MDPERLADWQAADALFDQWLDLPEPERDAWLAAQAPSGAVRRRLDQLIDAHRRPRAALDPSGDNLAGCRLGEWTLGSELGRGGMAVVYRAWREDGMARRQAALKILTLGALGATGRERFQREAEILARLNHPNITPLIDSGVAGDGTCWLAMPLVEGKRIDAWCDTQALDARSIVRLYLQVCGAVACAHRNLVIHRDIKPSNVLVEEAGHVRLLDFGIGQFTDAAAEPTQTLWRAMTPGYAAPEQLRGDPPSTAIDVYGLGALLHRLLTGLTPEAGDTTTRPSQLVRTSSHAYHRHHLPLRNDLDRVLLKALAEEPERRYASVEAFADDLRRWLDQRPVLAQEPSLGYRARKFIGRNRFGVAAGVLLSATLAAGVTATLWQAQEARREAENARVQAQRAILVRDFLQHVFQSTEPAAGGVPDALELLAEGARRARSDLLDSDPLAAADILMLTGQARRELDHGAEAEADLLQARELFARVAPRAWKERASIEEEIGHLLRDRGDGEGALRHSRAAVGLGEQALAEDGNAKPLLEARTGLGMALFASDPHAARGMFEDVLAALPGHGLQDTTLHITAIDGLSATVAATTPDDIERMVAISEEQIRLSRLIDGPDSGWYASTLADQVPTFGRAGDHVRAGELAREAVAIADRVYPGPHSKKAAAHCQLAAHLHLRGRFAEAVEHYAVASGINRELGQSNLHVQACFMFSGYANVATGDYPTALADMERSWEILGQHDYRTSPTGLTACGNRASLQLLLGDIGAAAGILADCPRPDGGPPVIQHHQAFAELHLARGQLAEAGRIAEELREAGPPEADDRYWMRPWMLSLLLAHREGREDAFASLVAALGEHAAMEPLSHCLAAPDEARCLAFP
ncbi:serine/threonine-protein kinase [Luteimonas arsenica]|uniref:serine/threonine-protein kinase n=1 Tax=Luteimonas arsenica TaxID=1586242 RepID=UPI001054F1E5|nr:serine/threonine-protein kinase [Luteimonas arsenica]